MLIVIVGISIFYINAQRNVGNKEKVSTDNIGTSTSTVVKDLDEADGVNLTLEASEQDVVTAMHHMSHQKVIAEQKWGAVPLTEGNIKLVHEIISNSEFKHKVFLMEISERWLSKDFSTIDDDHNYFWKLQGGTVGKAKGIMTKEQEEAYIEKNF